MSLKSKQFKIIVIRLTLPNKGWNICQAQSNPAKKHLAGETYGYPVGLILISE